MIQLVEHMLGFQSYNVQSPLNGQAARWVEEHMHRLPIEKEEFFIDLSSAVHRDVKTASQDQCSNCGATDKPLEPCGTGHVLCGDCVAHCKACGSVLCLACGSTSCKACAQAALAATAPTAAPRVQAPVNPTPPTGPGAATGATATATSTATSVSAVPAKAAPEAAAAQHQGWVCSNCGTRDTKAVQCRQKHILCSNCMIRCQTCGRGLCMMCGQYP